MATQQLQSQADPNIWVQVFTQNNFVQLTEFKPDSYILVDTREKLALAQSYLAKQPMLGIDTEQSFQSSYEGFLCLIQISTKKINFIIDVVLIQKEDVVQSLAHIFANPKIIKVFYAGDSDLSWLDRDFSIRVVNYLDIKLLQEAIDKNLKSSLTYLWETHCHHSADKEKKKQMQLSAWEKRPLTKEQLNYAALDTHFLLYLRFELIKQMVQKHGLEHTIDHLQKQQQQPKSKVFKHREYKPGVHIEFIEKFMKHKLAENQPEEEAKQQAQTIYNSSRLQQILKGAFLLLTSIREARAKEKNANVDRYMSSEGLADLVSEFISSGYDAALVLKKYAAEPFVKDNEAEISQTLASVQTEPNKFLEHYNKIAHCTGQVLSQYEQQKQQRKAMFSEKTQTHKVVYQNCQILSPNGLKLCNCDENKINWYLKRDLAEKISDKPLVIKLKFNPGGKGHSEIEEEINQNENCYYVTERKNQCVVCGNKESYMRYHVVPLLYRRFFPNQYKSHRSHDILLLCQLCHERASRLAEDKKKKIAEELKIPAITFSDTKVIQDKVRMMIGLAANYVQNKNDMPKPKRQEIKNVIRSHYYDLATDESIFKKVSLKKDTEIGLNKAQKIKINQAFAEMCKDLKNEMNNLKDKSNSEFKNYTGKLVLETLKTDEQIKDFIKMWRQYFLDTMKPQCLPSAWSVTHKFNREFGEHSVFKE